MSILSVLDMTMSISVDTFVRFVYNFMYTYVICIRTICYIYGFSRFLSKMGIASAVSAKSFLGFVHYRFMTESSRVDLSL